MVFPTQRIWFVSKFISIAFIIFLLFPISLKGQYGPLYWDLRDYDSLTGYRLAMNSFNNKQYDEAFSILDSLTEHYLLSGMRRKTYQLQNEKGAMLYVIRQFDKSAETVGKNLQRMTTDCDTLNYEYVVALRFMSYLTKVSEKPISTKLEYQKRQYNILKAMNDSSPLFIDCLSDIGLTHIYAGETEKSLDYFQESRKLAYLHKGMEHSLLITEHTMANLLEIEQPYLALKIFESQYATAPRSYYRDSASLVVLAYTLAEKYQRTGNPEKALQFFLKADSLQVLTGFPNSSLIPAIPLEIALCYSRKSDAEKYLEFASRAQREFEEATVHQPFPKENLYLKIAEGYGNLKNVSALKYFYEAVDMVKNNEVPDFNKLAYVYFKISSFHDNMGCIDKAIKAADTALRHLTTYEAASLSDNVISNYTKSLIDIYDHINLIYLKKYQQNAEHQLLSTALTAAIKYDSLMVKTAFTSSDASALLDYSINYKKLASRTLDVISEINGHEEIAYRLISNSKAFQLLNDRKRMDYAKSVALNDSLWQRKTALDKQVALLNNLKTSALIKNESEQAGNFENQMKNELIETLVTNFRIISRQSSENAGNTDSLNLKLIIGSIDKSQLILDVFQTDENIIVSAFNQNGILIRKFKGRKEFGEVVKNLLKSLKTGEEYQQYARIISNFLLHPFAEQLKNANHLVFIPDNNLQLIPLDILPNPITRDILLNSHSVSYHYSIPLWADGVKKKKPEQFSLLAMAPVYSSDTTINDISATRGMQDIQKLREIIKDETLAPLPYSLNELDKIKSLADLHGIPCTTFSHTDASKSNFKKFAGSFDILHLSAHGYVSKEEPQFSGIFLASDKKDSNGNYNPAWELLHLGELAILETPANLAVLSACNSASGAIHEGEGIMSLSRGCLIAGIPNVIAALWQVNDKNTSDLMISFYSYLFIGNTYSEALQKAKKDCIAKGMLPLDWSSFILTGN